MEHPTLPLALPPVDHKPRPYHGPSHDEVLARRRSFYNPAAFTYYKEPLMIVEGFMQYLYDERGQRFLDLIGGIVTVSCGHCHPKIVARLQEQVATLQHTTTIYLHPHHAELAQRLAEKLPDGLDVTYFVNSGSEANELAINMARAYTGHMDVIALRNAYHGASSTSMGLTSHHTWKYPVPQGGPIHHAICPDPYRSPFADTPDRIARRSAEDVRDLIRFSTPGKVAAFISEPIQGVGGVTSSPPGYLPEVYGIIRDHGGLCIADEVQTGFGRTGDHFWGFEAHDVVPDVVTMAKGFGNGVPLAAVTTRREVAEALTQRLHFNTFGGNPVSMAAGLAVLDVIEEDGLQERARTLGAYFKAGLEDLATRHTIIGDVRGQGLMLGMELVTDRATKAPATAATAAVVEAARHHHVLMAKGGLAGNVLRLKPPMCLSKEDIDYALAVLDQCLHEATA